MENEESKKFEQASNLNQSCLCRRSENELNAYRIVPKFAIGETVEIIKPIWDNVKTFKVYSIHPEISERGIEIFYKGGYSWLVPIRESRLKKVEA